MNNSDVMGLESRTRKRYQTSLKSGTLGLTPCHTHAKMCGKVEYERTTYDPNGSVRVAEHSEVPWVGNDPETTVSSKIPVCQATPRKRNQRGLYHTGVPFRSVDSGASDQQTQKIKPAGWLATMKDFAAVSLPLIEPEKLARDKPWYRLLTFSIHRLLSYGKVCVSKSWVCDR